MTFLPLFHNDLSSGVGVEELFLDEEEVAVVCVVGSPGPVRETVLSTLLWVGDEDHSLPWLPPANAISIARGRTVTNNYGETLRVVLIDAPLTASLGVICDVASCFVLVSEADEALTPPAQGATPPPSTPPLQPTTSRPPSRPPSPPSDGRGRRKSSGWAYALEAAQIVAAGRTGRRSTAELPEPVSPRRSARRLPSPETVPHTPVPERRSEGPRNPATTQFAKQLAREVRGTVPLAVVVGGGASFSSLLAAEPGVARCFPNRVYCASPQSLSALVFPYLRQKRIGETVLTPQRIAQHLRASAGDRLSEVADSGGCVHRALETLREGLAGCATESDVAAALGRACVVALRQAGKGVPSAALLAFQQDLVDGVGAFFAAARERRKEHSRRALEDVRKRWEGKRHATWEDWVEGMKDAVASFSREVGDSSFDELFAWCAERGKEMNTSHTARMASQCGSLEQSLHELEVERQTAANLTAIKDAEVERLKGKIDELRERVVAGELEVERYRDQCTLERQRADVAEAEAARLRVWEDEASLSKVSLEEAECQLQALDHQHKAALGLNSRLQSRVRGLAEKLAQQTAELERRAAEAVQEREEGRERERVLLAELTDCKAQLAVEVRRRDVSPGDVEGAEREYLRAEALLTRITTLPSVPLSPQRIRSPPPQTSPPPSVLTISADPYPVSSNQPPHGASPSPSRSRDILHRAEIESLQQECSSARERARKATRAMHGLQGEVRSLQAQLRTEQGKATKLREEVDSLRKGLREAEMEVDRWREALSDAERNERETSMRLEVVRLGALNLSDHPPPPHPVSETAESSGHVEALRNELQAQHRRRMEAEDEVESLRQAVAALEGRIALHIDEIAVLKKAKVDAEERADLAKVQLETNRQHTDSLLSRLEGLTKTPPPEARLTPDRERAYESKIKQLQATLEQDRVTWQGTVDELRSAVEATNADRSSTFARYQQLQDCMARMEREWEKERGEAEEARRAVEGELSESRARVEELEGLLTRTTALLDAERETAAGLREKVREMEEKLREEADEERRLQSARDDEAVEKQRWQRKVHELERRMSVESQNKRIQLAEMSSKAAAASAQSLEEVMRLKERLAASEEREAALVMEKDSLANQLKAARAEVERQLNATSLLQGQFHAFREEHADEVLRLKDSLRAVEHELQLTKAEPWQLRVAEKERDLEEERHSGRVLQDEARMLRVRVAELEAELRSAKGKTDIEQPRVTSPQAAEETGRLREHIVLLEQRYEEEVAKAAYERKRLEDQVEAQWDTINNELLPRCDELKDANAALRVELDRTRHAARRSLTAEVVGVKEELGEMYLEYQRMLLEVERERLLFMEDNELLQAKLAEAQETIELQQERLSEYMAEGQAQQETIANLQAEHKRLDDATSALLEKAQSWEADRRRYEDLVASLQGAKDAYTPPRSRVRQQPGSVENVKTEHQNVLSEVESCIQSQGTPGALSLSVSSATMARAPHPGLNFLTSPTTLDTSPPRRDFRAARPQPRRGSRPQPLSM